MNDLKQLISAAASKEDFEEVARLGKLASQIKLLDQQAIDLEIRKRDLVGSIGQNAPIALSFRPNAASDQFRGPSRYAGSSRSRGGLKVILSISGRECEICERNSAVTLVSLMERILAAPSLGINGLEKLTKFRVSRGPLLSRKPAVDYLNQRNSEIYAHHRIPGTDLYVLTHSSNKEKIEFIPRAIGHLACPGVSCRAYVL